MAENQTIGQHNDTLFSTNFSGWWAQFVI